MNKTLHHYLKETDKIHDFILKFGECVKIEVIEKKVNTIMCNIRNIQAVSKRMADISNMCNRIILNRNNNKKKKSEYISTYPTENDHAILRTKNPIDKKEVINSIEIPVKTLEKLNEIPVSNIYYINELKQYAINIAGVNIKGNLGNILDYNSENTSRCDYGIKCSSFTKGIKCKYYHEPEDYLKIGTDVPETIRNFTIGSWIYTNNKKPRTYFNRHIGNKKTLLYDLKMLKSIQYKEEVAIRESQLIHDLLIYIILHTKGLLEKYHHWSTNI